MVKLNLRGLNIYNDLVNDILQSEYLSFTDNEKICTRGIIKQATRHGDVFV